MHEYPLFIPPGEVNQKAAYDWNIKEARIYYNWLLNSLEIRVIGLLDFFELQYQSHLQKALVSKFGSVRYWSAQISAAFTSKDLLPLLIQLLKDEDGDIKVAALISLAQYSHSEVYQVIQNFVIHEKDSYIKEFALEILQDLP